MRKSTWERIKSQDPHIGIISDVLAREVQMRGIKPHQLWCQLTDTYTEYKKKHPRSFVVFNPPYVYDWEMSVVAMLHTFMAYGERIYKMGKDFSQELLKVEVDLPASQLPVFNKLFLIEFPDDMSFYMGPSGDENTKGAPRYARSAFVYTSDEDNMQTSSGEPVYRTLHIHLSNYDENGEITMETHWAAIPFLSPDESFETALRRIEERTERAWVNRAFMRFVLNCILYIDSGDPDLREYKPPRKPASNKAKVQRRFERQVENEAMVKMTLVGFDFKKPRTFSVDETERKGFMRWQRYGAGLANKKLIWIDPTIVHYKKTETAKNGEENV